MIIDYSTNPQMNWDTITNNNIIKIQKTTINNNPSILLRGESLIKNIKIDTIMGNILILSLSLSLYKVYIKFKFKFI